MAIQFGIDANNDTVSSDWIDLVLDDSISDRDRKDHVVWDFPLTDKYSKIWDVMLQNSLPQNFEEALERIRP